MKTGPVAHLFAPLAVRLSSLSWFIKTFELLWHISGIFFTLCLLLSGCEWMLMYLNFFCNAE